MSEEDEFSSGRSALRIASVAALGGLLFGYDSAVINGAVQAIQDEFAIRDAELGFAVASALLGAAAGAMTAGRVADRIGRVAVMKIAAALFLLSAVGAGLSTNIELLVIFRVIGGVGVGVASLIAPAYIAETSPSNIRGRLGSLQQLAIVTGIFLSLTVDWLLAHIAGGSRSELWLGLPAWRWMFLAMALPALVYGALAFTIPESPRYLVATHRIPEARTVLTRLLGEKNLDITITRIQETLDQSTAPSWRDLRKPTGGLYGIVWVGVALAVFQQLVGINVIFYYSNVLWQAVGFGESSSFTITVITSITNIATTLVAIALIDRVGRKPLLLIGSAGMAVTLSTMAIVFSSATVLDGKPHLGPVAGPVALVAANLFVVAFGMSWGPVVWVLLGEIFPNRIRAAAMGVATAGNWAANWLVTVSFPALRDSLGIAYGFYAICAVVSLVFVARWVNETKGRTLEDMESAIN
ncbi:MULTISPECIES: sugar porter family MFS transporter [Mycobacteroides]|jgi:sugar porter (SP) family MFS transporter|uniref:MFS transporter n=1 Tax=Mycobacteroides chelonae TaxID=1774 RepID=A0AB73MU30_MYCCH|nr:MULTISPECIES: sugar porter family MFS transporter [Mycobacteroides]KRQ30616.1 MFS transporter [Mycobacteroides sp. H072]KRQ32145.1 MFS transporter [Mycobacteroides sp. H002]KRQ50051.1 MFS transporter [Mycobacteroides sp. H054]KRQ67420.1 MFS transporter [Mycobacteroides sp. H001]MBF9317426.1 sugar porter family MFS transporter [Mycobacteroides chelonae]